MRIHFVIHEAFEAPGAYETWAERRGHDLHYSRVYRGEPLPLSNAGIDMLIVMGGPQSPATTTAECPHFDARAEATLIADCVAAGRAVLGICLGSQLIGEALGAPFEHSPEKEIGVFPITLTAKGRAHEHFAHFGDVLPVGHWHGDMPGLTDRAEVIAFSEGCPRQIVEYAPFVYGFQCHMEFTPHVIELLIDASIEELAALEGRRFVQSPATLRRNDYSRMNDVLYGFLDRLTTAYQANKAP